MINILTINNMYKNSLYRLPARPVLKTLTSSYKFKVNSAVKKRLSSKGKSFKRRKIQNSSLKPKKKKKKVKPSVSVKSKKKVQKQEYE